MNFVFVIETVEPIFTSVETNATNELDFVMVRVNEVFGREMAISLGAKNHWDSSRSIR
jgi:hypothetical protein